MTHRPSLVQRIAARLSRPETLARLEAESRQWIATCPEGHRHDIWSLGGIRAGAHGTKTSWIYCPDCARRRPMRVARA